MEVAASPPGSKRKNNDRMLPSRPLGGFFFLRISQKGLTKLSTKVII